MKRSIKNVARPEGGRKGKRNGAEESAVSPAVSPGPSRPRERFDLRGLLGQRGRQRNVIAS